MKKFLAGATTALLALGLVSLVAAPASAHTGDLDVTAVCNTQTHQYDFTAKLKIAQTSLNGSTHYKVGTSTFDHTPKQSDPTFSGAAIVSTNNPSTITLTTFSLPGSTTGYGPWVYAQTTFTDNYFVGSDGQLLQPLDGTCGDDTTKKITICHATASGSNPWVKQTPNVSSIIQGLGGHGSSGVNVDDIIPPFDYTQNGVVKHYDGNNWSAGGQQIWNNDCTQPGAPRGPTYTEAVCTATGQTGDATVTIPSGVTGAQYWIKSSNTGNTYATIAQGTTASFPAGTTVRVKVTPLSGYELSIKPVEFASHPFTNVASKCVQPVQPTVVQSTCTAPGEHGVPSYTIIATDHVTYKVGNSTVSGTKLVYGALPKTVTVTAVVSYGYILVGPSSFTLTFADPGDCLQDVSVTVGFENAICTAPSTSTDATYTLPDVKGVSYSVTINGVAADSSVGTHVVVPKNASIVVDVTADPGYRLTSPGHNTWSYTDPGACLVDAGVSTVPTFSQTACNVYVPGGITPAAYTLYAADHISYEVSTDNVTFAPKAVGTWNLDPGQHVWIHALADPGYILVGPGEWDFTSADLGVTCDYDATPATPAWVDAVCHDARPGHTHATYTVIAAEGVHYKVSTDLGATWTDATPGVVVKVAPDAVVWVQPIADPGYQLTDSSILKHEFVDPGNCELTIDYVQPTATDATCTEGDVTPGSYTLADVEHVTYNVRVNGVLTKNVAPGTYTADNGDHVVVTTVADKGWNFGDAGRTVKWIFDFVSDGLCAVSPVEATVTDQICTVGEFKQGVYTDGVVTIPSTTGVQYTLDGEDVDAGPHSVTPGDHIVAAIALENYKLADYTGPWTLTSKLAPVCGDLPSHPIVLPEIGDPQGCAATATFTLGNNLDVADAVIWTIDGQPANAGSHSIAVGTSVHVHAEPNGPVFGFTEDQQKDWTVAFTNAATCGDLKTLALTGGSLPTGLIGGGALLLVAGLSLLSVQMLRRRRDQV
ncbi:hypothetical protein GCM10009840_07240 [Pseudolysinimonas kribbensis]